MSFRLNSEGNSVKLVWFDFCKVLKYVMNFNVDIICHIIYLFMFVIYVCLIRIRAILDKSYWWLYDFLFVSKNYNHSEIRSYLKDKRRTFNKLPGHIVIILGSEKASHEDLAKFISWCEPLGISHISFYDHKRSVDPVSIFEAVKKYNRHIIHKIKWGKSFSESIKISSLREINGHRWEGLIFVNILRDTDGSMELVEISKQLHATSEKVCVDQTWLANAMEKKLGAPSPDLAVVCGPVISYYACLPWHIRLTQFVHIGSHHSMRLSKFLNCLHQYSQCEQRFGK